MRNSLILAGFLLIILIAGIYLFHPSQKTAQPQSTPQVQGVQTPLGQRTKTTLCIITSALPDHGCTPGAVITGASVDQICQSGYAKSVRNVPESEKDQVYLEYGITSRTTGEYEVDHLISLELGGSNDIANLWPEPANPRPGFHEKDKVENYLHDQVCSGNISLEQAQQEISSNWLQVYQQIQ